ACGGTRSGPKFRMLMKFDFAGKIPADATINSVKLTLHVTKRPSPAVASSFELHRLLKDWNEGAKPGSPGGSAASTDEVTWKNQAHPNKPWSAAGAAAPNDFVTQASSAQNVDAPGPVDFNSTATLAADVQQWVRDPATNF